MCILQQYQKLPSPGLQPSQSAANMQNQMHLYPAQKQMQQGVNPTSFNFSQQQGPASYKQMQGQYPPQMAQLSQQQQLGRAQSSLQRPPTLTGIPPVTTATPIPLESENKILSKRSIQDLVTQVKFMFGLLGIRSIRCNIIFSRHGLNN